MRDLDNEELFHVYGAGGRSKSPCPPTKRPKCGRGGSSRGGSSGGYKRCKGGSS